MPARRRRIEPIRWVPGAGTGGGWWAMSGGWFVGQVIHYDVPEGWAGWLHGPDGGPVPGGPWATIAEAQAALGAAWTASCG